jgi:small subunit ribosomal protein S17
MADETDNDTTEMPEAARAPAEVEGPEATDAAPVAEQSEAAADQVETPAEQAPGPPAESAEAPAAEEATQPPPAPAESAEAPAAEQAPAPASAPPAEPKEQLSPKERRRRARARHDGQPRPKRTPQERQAERLQQRRAKAVTRRARRLRERAKAAERRASAPASEPLAPVHAPVEGVRKTRLGTVVSAKADKTITVRIEVARRHRRYEKIVRSSTTLHAHDENNDAHEGDLVRVVESRPLSRTKRWQLVDVLERAR